MIFQKFLGSWPKRWVPISVRRYLRVRKLLQGAKSLFLTSIVLTAKQRTVLILLVRKTSLEVQWLRICIFTTGGMGLIPGAGGVPCGWDGKEYTSNAGDLGPIPWSEDPRRREYLPTPVFLPGESPWTEEPGGLPSMVSQGTGHYQATQTFILWGTKTPHASKKEKKSPKTLVKFRDTLSM